jgi:hypothetical protein
MKQLLAAIVYLSFLSVTSCSIPNLYEDSIISYTKGNRELIITNNGNHTIYYLIVEQETAARIDWTPSLRYPNIPSRKHVVIKYSEIFTVENQLVTEGAKVIFYYWNSLMKSTDDVKYLLIKI